MSDSFDRLVAIMDRLRDPGGCPWDREQTLASLSGYLLEEAYEVIDAVEKDDGAKLCEELGDLLLQIVFMARIGREKDWFGIDDVADSISEKMVRRHPHVFAGRRVDGSAEVLRNWEDIKKEERRDRAETSAMDGIPNALPGLLKAFRMTEKAAALGFDWERPLDVMVKIREEVDELEAELERDRDVDATAAREELGDVLFAFANLARHLSIEPETALQRANSKFMTRFREVERRVHERGHDLRELPLETLDAIWDEVKADERQP